MTRNEVAEYKEAALIETLRKCQLFRGLPEGVIKEIAGFTAFVRLDKEATLFLEGEPSRGFYIVQKGMVKVHRVNAHGREQVIHLFRAGESFAEGALVMDGGYPADATAVDSCQLLLVKKEGFVSLIYEKPELALRMLASLSVHLRILVGQIDDLKLKSVETRLTNWLVKRCPDTSSEEPYRFTLGVKKRVLASEIGTVSETLSRTLAKLKQDGLIDIDGKRVTVYNPARLASLLRELLGE